MNSVYERDLDLNLLRVLLVVADTGSVTEAARVLYLTQPAVSAALKRLQTALGVELLAREGRGIALTARGRALVTQVRPHLEGIVHAARTSGGFDPATSERVVRLGLSDAMERWLLPELLRRLAVEAPNLALVVQPVQFRTVAAQFEANDVELAVTVADELPSTVCREPLMYGSFVVLFDPRHHEVGETFPRGAYFDADHVIVSYNGDRRGLVEDFGHGHRRVRVAIATFHAVGDIVDDSALLATVPRMVAATVRNRRPHLRTAQLPFDHGTGCIELLWRRASSDDPAVRFVRDHVVAIAGQSRPEA